MLVGHSMGCSVIWAYLELFGTARLERLVFVDQASVKQLQGARTPTTRIDPSRVLMGMQRVGGRWLVATLSAL